MKLSSRTVNDQARLLRFTRYVGLHKLPLWIALFAVTAIVTVPYVLMCTGGGIDARVIIAFCLIIGIDFFYVCSYFIIPVATVKKAPLLNVTIVFTFLDSIFAMDALTKKGSDRSTFRYSDLVKIAESKEDLYLYITKSQAFIVDKSGFTSEELNELKDYISSKLKTKKK